MRVIYLLFNYLNIANKNYSRFKFNKISKKHFWIFKAYNYNIYKLIYNYC